MPKIKSREQLVLVPLYFIEKEIDGCTKFIVLSDEKYKKMIEDEKIVEKPQVFKTYWKVLSWQENNAITKASTTKDADSFAGEIDYIRYRDLKIKTCLKKWDLQDDEGKDIPASPEEINKLPFNILYPLFEKYEKITTPSEEDLKNL